MTIILSTEKYLHVTNYYIIQWYRLCIKCCWAILNKIYNSSFIRVTLLCRLPFGERDRVLLFHDLKKWCLFTSSLKNHFLCIDNLNMIHSQLCGALQLTLVFLFQVFFHFGPDFNCSRKCDHDFVLISGQIFECLYWCTARALWRQLIRCMFHPFPVSVCCLSVSLCPGAFWGWAINKLVLVAAMWNQQQETAGNY